MKCGYPLLIVIAIMLSPVRVHGIERTATTQQFTNKVRINTLQMQLNMQAMLIAQLKKQTELTREKAAELCAKTPGCAISFK